ncbi:hypothetical protein GGI07_000628 [Coemansia sp. Benny D115]|nr:hypothetical protein GGI07_000628 [Coemansia sp. Benny D115]
MASIPPNHTLYLRNLNDRIHKDVLKQTLYSLCLPYGRVLDIVALKTLKMRGQAFIVFNDITSSTAALRQLNGYQIFGRPMSVEYALSKSDATAIKDGTFQFGQERKHMSAKDRKIQLGLMQDAKRRHSDDEVERKRRMVEPSSDSEDENMAIESDVEESDDDIGPRAPDAENAAAPSSTLFVSDLPGNVSADMLAGLFQQYQGFLGVRMIPGKSDMAFVDYEGAGAAAAALSVLNGFMLAKDQPMKVVFSR